MDSSHLAIVLLFLTLALLVAEIFIPSGGMIMVVALISLAASVWFAWKAWWDPSNQLAWWSYVAAVLILLPTALGGALYVFPRTPLGKKFLLEAPSLEEVASYAEDERHLAQMIGKTGRTLTLLNPGGLVLVEGERMHCESEGVMIDPGQEVVIVARKGNRVVVRQAPPKREVAQRDGMKTGSDRPSPEADSLDEPPLDFDLPQS